MTLVMLSVITVMAVAFLALTQRERMSVAQSIQQSDAELMADVAAERAKAEVFARFLASTNLIGADLLVSRNYIRTNGFIVNSPVQPDVLNVNYEYRVGGAPGLPAGEFEQNIANLYYDPRVPVFVDTNVSGVTAGPLEFRFYLDLNRNGRFETNGAYPLMDINGDPIRDTDYHFIGDPEWVGVLENPLFPHSRTNRFIGRYAYIALPIGKSLDINYIHNHAKATQADQDGFLRNQGYGPWELNLAAFLADLNTDVWNPPTDFYRYRTNLPGQGAAWVSEGAAFRDAWEIYTTRFGSYQNIAPAYQLLMGSVDFAGDFIDAYADGPLDDTGKGIAFDDDPDLNSATERETPWPGSFLNKPGNARTNFFTPHDFFEIFGTYPNFRNRLRNVGFANSSYDRYTYYRMLAQLSTDSGEQSDADLDQLKAKIAARNLADFVAEPVGKINLNYNNLDYSITNMIPWDYIVAGNGNVVPGDTNRFFNAVADVLIRSQFNFGVSNIYVTNYNVTIHRMLQLAANIYDSINQSASPFPSIFRPFVTNDNGAIQIRGYYYDDNALNVAAWVPNAAKMPMVVAAKKGLPNFNEYVAETVISAARKLEMRRRDTNSGPYQTNEMLIIGIDHRFGIEAWNSYTNQYSNTLQVAVADNVYVSITNSDGLNLVSSHVFSPLNTYSSWPRYHENDDQSVQRLSFRVPLYTNAIALSNGIYRPGAPPYIEPLGDTNDYVPNSGFHNPEWTLTVSNNLIFVMSSGNRLVDFVHLPFMTNVMGLTTNFFNPTAITSIGEPLEVALCWNTNRRGSSIYAPTDGVQRQIDISLGSVPVGPGYWIEFANVNDPPAAKKNFYDFLHPPSSNTNLIQQVPFTPARKIKITAKWEANDPLIHHMEQHLKLDTNNHKGTLIKPFISESFVTNTTLWDVNAHYRPWGGRPGKTMTDEDVNMALKDPGVRKSDDWDFPTNRFPSIGWLGRVHRGTPWQTVYLKSPMAELPVWANYSLDPLSHPTNDWKLLDIFTVAVHPNASRGQLSINQTNFAAWSALFSGVLVLSNTPALDDAGNSVIEKYEPWTIEPGSQQLQILYEAIQKRREQFPDKVFRRLGDLLSVAELTELSPFLDRSDAEIPVRDSAGDVAWERIPQQVLSLLKVGDPRYVIYAYGQSLRPADNSILTSGSHMGMCTNYQVTGEFVSRSVLQIEGTAGQPRPITKSFNILSAE